MKKTAGVIFCLFLVFFLGCQTYPEVETRPVSHYPEVKPHKQGPPPHAPAHGYRHKQKHHTLEYNDEAGAYVVVKVPGTYFVDGLYLRLSTDGRWRASAQLEGGWRMAVGNEVPPKLKTYHKKQKKQKKQKKKKKY